MKKLIFSFTFVLSAIVSFSQVTSSNEARTSRVAVQLKSELVSKAGLSVTATDKISVIEAEFFKRFSIITEQQNLLIKDREKRLNEAHVTRRSKLTEIPLTARQIEDVILLSESIQRKNK